MRCYLFIYFSVVATWTDKIGSSSLVNCQCFVMVWYVEDAKVYQIDTPNMEQLQTIFVEVAPVHFPHICAAFFLSKISTPSDSWISLGYVQYGKFRNTFLCCSHSKRSYSWNVSKYSIPNVNFLTCSLTSKLSAIYAWSKLQGELLDECVCQHQLPSASSLKNIHARIGWKANSESANINSLWPLLWKAFVHGSGEQTSKQCGSH